MTIGLEGREGHDTFVKVAGDAALLVVVGIFLGLIGPYGIAREPALARYAFWLLITLSGGLAAIIVERALRRRIRSEWLRTAAASAAITLPMAYLVLGAMVVLLGHAHGWSGPIFVNLIWQAFVINIALMAVRMLVHRPPLRIVESRTIIAPPLPDAEARLRSRLSARRRAAKLIAIEAHDHYVRVHTGAGVELIGLRFADAVAELAGAHGFRVHRSWWVAADAIKDARWRRGSGELRLEDGLAVPVSRSGAPALRMAGWL
ncbi:MAG: LytTR family transcriptional regulator [Sphingosinicella sp.]|nr:LytTR family transcriptional regulator [Sphingosinicella sp.]